MVFRVLFCLLLLPLLAAPATAQETDAAAPEDDDPAGPAGFEIVAELEQGPGNVAVTPDGRIILSQHQFFEPEYRVVELTPDGDVVPFPNPSWSSAPGPDGKGLHAVLGVVADQRGVVWMVDNGGDVPRIVGWDTRTDRLHRVIPLPPHAAPEGAFPNDLAVDVAHEAIYLADFGGKGGPALIVVDLRTGRARRVLQGHESVVAEDIPMVIDGYEVTLGPSPEAEPARVGVNPIAIDPTNTWVYYGAMHGDDLWRVRARDLLDASLTPDELAARVERFGDKPVSDGITLDAAGHVYVSDVTQGAIGVTGPDGGYRVYARDHRIEWPDGFAAGPDGWIYVTINKLHLTPMLNKGRDEAQPPFYLARFKALGPTVVGR